MIIFHLEQLFTLKASHHKWRQIKVKMAKLSVILWDLNCGSPYNAR